MSSGFISESDAAEARKKRQEEWEKVRKADDPLERPEEPYDARSLYDRLQEQKQKKDLEYEEAHKLKNMIKGLDDDEIEFLDLVDRTKLAADRRKTLEEEQELNDYRNRVATLQEKALQDKLQVTVARPKVTSNGKTSQIKLLMGAVVKKTAPQKRKSCEDEEKPAKQIKVCNGAGESDCKSASAANEGLKCIGVLPGIGPYTDSSSEDSSDSEVEGCISRVDLVGRKIEKKDKEHN